MSNDNKTKVVHCKKHRYDVYIGRPSVFGNPYKMAREKDRPDVLRKYAQYLSKRCADDGQFRAAVHSLKGKTLACWCSPKPCHGDVIVAWLECNE